MATAQWIHAQAAPDFIAFAVKRLGDGFYEQKLVREQVAQLTGQRFLADYTSDDQQYRALMDAGITFAKTHQLRPGIALSAAQVAQLTSDIVWLVEQTIALPDGSTTQALVPQVYVRVKQGDLDGTGALLAGRQINLNLSGDITNTGTISGSMAGRNIVSLTAQNVNNLAGRISGDAVAVAARDDLNNIGGTIAAQSQLMATAGRDLNVVTTTQSTANRAAGVTGAPSFTRTGVDRVTGLYVTGTSAPGTLIASAGRDINITAGVVANTTQGGSTFVSAERNVNLGTVTTERTDNSVLSSANHLKQSQSAEVGSQITGAGDVRISAKADVNARAASVQAQGALSAVAGSDINITAGQNTQSFDEARQSTSKGFLSKSTITTRSTSDSTTAVGSTLGGNTVLLSAGNNLSVRGSEVIADKDATLLATNNITLEAAQNTSSTSNFRSESKSGLFTNGGLSVTIGKKQQSTDQKDQSTTAAASTVGSIGGNVNIVAGQTFKQVGSDVIAPAGDINILAKDVQIVEARETSASQTETKSKQSGLTVAISSPVVSGVQSVQGIAQAARNTSSGRMQGLAVASAAMTVNSTVNSIGDAATALGKGDLSGGASLNISVGSSKSQSNTTAQSDTAKGSTVAAGGNVNITATRASKDSNLLIQGSAVRAVGNVTLAADNEVTMQAAKNTSSQSSTNSASSGSIGVSISAQGVSATASASKGKGKSDGQDLSYTNSQISAGNTVSITSGGDTNVKGAVVAANQIKADVGTSGQGSLNIESLQDTSTYTSSQRSSGFSVSVPITGSGSAGGSVSASKSKIDSNFQSVGEQSGLKAGDGGFQVSVANNTDLKGGVIASTQKAVDSKANTFTTGGQLITTDVQNTASFSGKASGFSIEAGAKGIGGVGIGAGNDKGSAASTTAAGITGVAGNKAVRASDAETGLQKIFDADKTQKKLDAENAITTAFTKQAPKAAATFLDNQIKDIKVRLQDQTLTPAKRAELEQDIVDRSEGGIVRIVVQTAVGAMGGGAGGALGAGISASAAPMLNEFQDSIAKRLEANGMSPGAAKVVAQGITGLTIAGVGAVVGGMQGATYGAAVDFNNRQLHPTERQRAAVLAANSKGKFTKQQIEEQMRLMGNVALGVKADTITVLHGQSIPDSRNGVQDPVPLNVYGNVAIEIPGQANAEIQQFIIASTKDGAGYIPGASPYQLSNAALDPPNRTNTPPANTVQTAKCANSDFACKSGMGVQQSVPLTDEQKTAMKENITKQAQDVSRLSGVVANTVVVIAPNAAGARIVTQAATVGLGSTFIEQLVTPDKGKLLVESGIDFITKPIADRFPMISPVINEFSEFLKNTRPAETLKDRVGK